MVTKKNRVLLVLAALLVLVSTAQAQQSPPRLEPDYVTIRTNWLFSGIHAWLFYGREKGYFKEQNIVVDIREGNGSGNVVRTVINKGDDFALVSIGNPIISTAQGAPLKIIYTWLGAFNWGYMCRPESVSRFPRTSRARSSSAVRAMPALITTPST